ncbi:hypothetical protein F5876DRAFT_65376 [Lentinula aff. lateritia]|uniref:Uncharacterized protein n=1 Tax=Lentinula aff. lateritia TaxID=2804960 RepID=A0ACC1U121_9AGAR|nr:hypothetical protein F5876DRAFT_65376 [Lentinula aff. lateritia]
MFQSRLSELPLPTEIFREIASCIPPRNATEILNFALTARLVHQLILRPNYLRMTSKKRLLKERELALGLQRLAPNLSHLRKFVWDGLEIPESDLWAALRAGCPLLKEIGTNLGCEKFDFDSELFAFSGLQSFSLTTELHGGRYDVPDPDLFPFGDQLPPALWTMIVDRSPQLQSLVLGDIGATLCGNRTLDIRPMMRARWPNLESLSLDTVSVSRTDEFMISPRDKQLFSEFFEQHKYGLKHLSYHRFDAATYGTIDDQDDNEESAQSSVADAPHSNLRQAQNFELALVSHGLGFLTTESIQYHVLQELMFTDEGYHLDWLPLFEERLRDLPNLKKFGVWVDFSRTYSGQEKDDEGNPKKPTLADQTKVLRELYESCPPKLESLKLLLSTKSKETIYWRDIPSILRRNDTAQISTAGRCQLKQLEIWKVLRFGDRERLRDEAIKIALDEDHGRLGHAADHNNDHDVGQSSGPLKFTAPLLENIVLVVCLEPWSISIRQRVEIIQHASYKVHRQYINHSTLDSKKILEATSSVGISTHTQSQQPRMSKKAFFGALPSSVRKLKVWAQTWNTFTVPEMIVKVKAHERTGEHVSSNRYELQLVPMLSSHGKMMMDGRRLRFGSPTMVIGGHKADHKKELNEIGLGRQWRAVRVTAPTNSPFNGVIARSWKKLLRSEECMEIGLDQTC